MRVLLVFATALERDAVVPESLPAGWKTLVCGVGMVETAVNLSRYLARHSPALVLQLGIAGAYPDSGLQVGDLVRVPQDSLVELGCELADGNWRAWDRPDLGGQRVYREASPHAVSSWFAALSALPVASGATVNSCTGTRATALLRSSGAQVESMEGAAFFAACQEAGVAGFQIRAISNVASDRDETAWRIPAALTRLREWLQSLPFF